LTSFERRIVVQYICRIAKDQCAQFVNMIAECTPATQVLHTSSFIL